MWTLEGGGGGAGTVGPGGSMSVGTLGSIGNVGGSDCAGEYETLAGAFAAKKISDAQGRACHIEDKVAFSWSLPLFKTHYVLVNGEGPVCPFVRYGNFYKEDAKTCAREMERVLGGRCSVVKQRELGSNMTGFAPVFSSLVQCVSQDTDGPRDLREETLLIQKNRRGF